MKNDQARIGLIGAGNRGVGCFGRYIPDTGRARIAAIADPNLVRARAALGVLAIDVPCYDTPEELLRREPLDGVVITTPDYLHAAHTVAAIEAGVRHILVDKPLATTVADCLQVRDAARQADSVVAMGFNLRHVPVIAKIKQLVDDGAIGRLMLIENREFYAGGRTYFGRWNGSYQLSGGLWVHKGSHDFDVYNWWNPGGVPSRVMASAGVNALRPEGLPFTLEPGRPAGPHCTACSYAEECPDFNPPVGGPELFNDETAASDNYRQDKCVYLAEADVHDNGIALVEYSNNVRASHMECFACGFTDRCYTLIGDRGVLTANLSNPGHIELRPRWGDSCFIGVPPAPEGTHGGADPLLTQNFIDEIHNGAQPSSTLRDGLRSIAIGQAAEIAWRERRSVELEELVAAAELV